MAKRWKRTLVYLATAALARIGNFLPRRIAILIGEFLGLAIYGFRSRERRSALANLRRAFGQAYSPVRRRVIARKAYTTFGRSLVEMMRLRKWYAHQIRPEIEVIGEEHFRSAYERGRGVVVFTGHIGNYELLATYVAQSGYKTAVIGRRIYDRRIDSLLVANRTAMGILNLPSDSSPLSIVRRLNEGYALGALIDTDSFRVAGELTPFFGRLAKTPTGPAQLGLMAGAAFVPMFCLSFPGGKYRIIMGEELTPESCDRSRENVYRLTCRMTRIIEQVIREYPEQWIWPHNRWHTRPQEDDCRFLASQGIRV